MTAKEKNKYEVGKWYKDRDGDFIKFSHFRDCYLEFTAKVRNGRYHDDVSSWGESAFPKCIPMTQDEMKEHLPESEWLVKPTSDLFPIY